MHLSQVDLNLFVVFEAIYNRRNLTRAADVLCITQPAVSNALARMRVKFNDPLFVSTPQGMVPTPVAERMVDSVRDALKLLRDSLSVGAVFDPATTSGVYRLSMSDLTEPLLLPTLVERLSVRAPGVRIESQAIPRNEVPLELARGEIDLALDAPVIADPQLAHELILTDYYACMLRPEHPFRRKSLRMQDYLALQHMHISSRRKGVGYVDAELAKLGLERKIRMRAQHYMVGPLIAMNTDLALTAPTSLLGRYQGRMLKLPFAVPPLEVHSYWHCTRDRDPANVWLRSQVMQCMREAAHALPRVRKRSR
jgi:DNA-binding transcriptional LysR family regulator